MLSGLTALLIPALLGGMALFAALRGVDAYGALCAGARDGLRVVKDILPPLAVLLTAVAMLRASGALDALAAALSPALRATLLQLKEHGLRTDSVYQCHRLNNFCGSWIHHCGWYPDAKIRLWPTGHAQWHGTIHEELIHDQCPNTVTLKGDLLHYSFYSIDEMTLRHRRYYLLAAQAAHDAGRKATMTAVVLKPLWAFLRGYVLLGGFLDGHAGYLVCRMNAHYTFMKYATLREMTKKSQSSTKKQDIQQ